MIRPLPSPASACFRDKAKAGAYSSCFTNEHFRLWMQGERERRPTHRHGTHLHHAQLHDDPSLSSNETFILHLIHLVNRLLEEFDHVSPNAISAAPFSSAKEQVMILFSNENGTRCESVCQLDLRRVSSASEIPRS